MHVVTPKPRTATGLWINAFKSLSTAPANSFVEAVFGSRANLAAIDESYYDDYLTFVDEINGELEGVKDRLTAIGA